MSDLLPDARPIVEWGWAGSALETESGDLHVVVDFPGGVLVALIDGLGHGPDAAAASYAAVPVLQGNAGAALPSLVVQCHEALRKTRGAVMSIAAFRLHDSSMSWIGVGNVDGVLVRTGARPDRSHEAIAVRSGVVGYQLPPLREHTLQVSRGDTLIMTTDGIRSGFVSDLVIGGGLMTDLAGEPRPQEIAESILARFAKGTDDAHVIVARYLGGVP